MRDIKFRAWHKKNKKILTHNFLKSINHFALQDGLDPSKFIILGFSEDIEFTQYTGLKDKNGVEIYEGDILKISNISVLRCEFRNGCFVLVHSKEFTGVKNLLWGNLGRLYDAGMNDIFELTEVIGNIYENSNLLGDNIEQN